MEETRELLSHIIILLSSVLIINGSRSLVLQLKPKQKAFEIAAVCWVLGASALTGWVIIESISYLLTM